MPPRLAQLTAKCPDSQLPCNNSCCLDFIEGGAGAVDFLEDCSAFGLPGVGFRGRIAIGEIGFDVTDEFTDGGEAAGADHVGGQIGKEAFDEVHPGRRCRREVRLEARVAGEPGLDLRMLMSGIVVLDQMDVEFLGRFAVDLLQESQPFDMSVARLSARDQLAFHRIERRTDRAMPGVVVRHRPGTLGRKRQTELSTLQSLALALLVAA